MTRITLQPRTEAQNGVTHPRAVTINESLYRPLRQPSQEQNGIEVDEECSQQRQQPLPTPLTCFGLPTQLPQGSTRLISTKLLIRGPASLKPLKDQTVILQLGQIMAILPTANIPPPFKSLPSTSVPVLMPGLWDCHIHLLGAKTLNFSEILLTSPVVAGARLTNSLVDILHSGVTSVRDLGSHALSIAPAVKEGSIAGPHIYSAGAAISQTAGHGDIFDLPWGFVQSRLGVSSSSANNNEAGSFALCLADGVDEVRRAVRLQIRRGAQVIKVLASGGVLSIADDPLRQQFSDEELRTAVEEAERLGRIVAAHVHGKAGIMAALKAGVKTIEHGTYMDDECAELAKRNGVIYIPTRTVVKVGVAHPELMSPESYKKMVETAKHHLSAYRLAVKAGVKIALGTDTGVSIPRTHPLALGQSGQELVYAVKEAGMSPAHAIEAATAHGPDTLGELGMKPKTGRVEVGYDADLIALNENPLENIDVFMKPKNVTHVWKSGEVAKEPK